MTTRTEVERSGNKRWQMECQLAHVLRKRQQDLGCDVVYPSQSAGPHDCSRQREKHQLTLARRRSDGRLVLHEQERSRGSYFGVKLVPFSEHKSFFFAAIPRMCYRKASCSQFTARPLNSCSVYQHETESFGGYQQNVRIRGWFLDNAVRRFL